MARILASARDAAGIPDLSIIGPSPTLIHKIRGRYNWQLILRGTNFGSVLHDVTFPYGWTVDIDPAGTV